MIAKFKDGTPCTIRALLAFNEKYNLKKFSVTFHDTSKNEATLFATLIDKKPNGRIKYIEFIVLVPLYTDFIGDTYYKEIKFSGNEKAANDFLDDQIFAHGYRVLELEDMIIPNDEDILIWSADQTGKVATGSIKKLRPSEKFMLRCPLTIDEKKMHASINEKPQLDVILDSIPKLNREHESKTLNVSSACEGMYMDTD